MADRIRVGFIGSGNIAKAHLGEKGSGLSGFPDVELVGFCDAVPERAQAAADTYGGAAFTRPAEMLDSVAVDALFLCLPPFAHGEAELEATRRGIPFFVEKPVGLDLDVLREIEQAVREKDLLTSVGYMNRYRKGVQRAKAILAEDPAVILHGGWIGGQARVEGPDLRWWFHKDKSGGQLVEQTTHTVDIVRYLCGEAEEVFAEATRAFNTHMPPAYTIDDASTVALKFRGGTVANLMSACACNVGGGVWLTVYSRNAKMEFRGWEHTVTLQQKGQDPEEIPGEEGIFVVEDRAFIDAVKSGDRSGVLCSYADGVKSCEITLAANRSMETGQPVKLPM